ncbi:sulfatase-like hydrolase/transferase [Halomonas ramblicola]|uniref:sulfatase-like hydrolase/transferase n=1 Tax=Halomonas ramblicola TaxID=747349 RepID=UPI0025B299C2|nr:sulfatase-like hydrolase/transferase [Halomonas ramblicola]MDN3522884.1 sulfatase-like hydrolase/transferase [Halomonas ramblicola]
MIRHLLPLLRQPRWWALLVMGLCLGHAVTTVALLSDWGIVPIAAAWLGLGWLLRWGAPADHPPPPGRVWPWSLIPLILWGVYVYLAESFGIVELGAIFFHLQAGMQGHGGISRSLAAIAYTLSMLAFLVAFIWLVRHDHRWRRFEWLLAVVLLASNPLFYGVGQRGAAIVTDDGAWLDRRYVEPTIRRAPERPPNLLLLYLESIERTYADRERFGDAYAFLDAIGRRGHVFEGVRQLENTGWTMAGMIASQCGAPLMPAGLLHDTQFEPLGRVVPGVECLGDLLADQGYRLTFMGGASTDFAGKGIFYEDHGFQAVLGRDDLEPRLEDPDYVNNWGLFDDSLYDMTVERIRRLEAAGDAPWGLVSLSLAGHAPNGYPARACEERQGEFDGEDILYAVECSAWLTHNLLERLEAEGLLANTLVVIASDHLSMKVSAWEDLVAGERANTFMLLGPGIEAGRRTRREASTIDLFPTILEAMGFTIGGHRAGLGVSLLSDERTLVERHGTADIAARMHEETALQQRLWEGLVPESRRKELEPSPPEQVVETPEDEADELEPGMQ